MMVVGRQGYLPDAMINYLALLGWNDGSDKGFFGPPYHLSRPLSPSHTPAQKQICMAREYPLRWEMEDTEKGREQMRGDGFSSGRCLLSRDIRHVSVSSVSVCQM